MKFLAVVFEILWARRAIVLVATLASLIGGVGVILTGAPRYVATARVVLDYIKPDPVTGARVGRKQVDAYVQSQISFIHDYAVAIPAAESLGLMDNPDMADAYAAIPGEKPDYQEWVAQRILATLTVNPYQDTNILEIKYRAPTKAMAREVAEAVRAAYIDATVASRRQSAESSATQLSKQVDQLKASLVKAQGDQANMQRVSGIFFTHGDKDLDTRTLVALATPEQHNHISAPPVTTQFALSRAATLESQLAEAERVLGPNNPKLQALQAQQKLLKDQAAKTVSAAAQTQQAQAVADRATLARAEEFKAKVLNERTTLLQLQLQQDLIDGYTNQINTLTANISAMRQMASAQATSISPLGQAKADSRPSFPNPPLILGGATGLGLAVGAMLALLCEMFARRIRNRNGLTQATGAPLLAAVPKASFASGGRTRRQAPMFSMLRRKQAA